MNRIEWNRLVKVLRCTLIVDLRVSLPQFYVCWQKAVDICIREKGLFRYSKKHGLHNHISSSPYFPTHIPSTSCRWVKMCSTHSGFVSQMGNFKSMKLQYFIMNCKHTWPICSPEGKLIFIKLNSKQFCPQLWKETLSLSSRAIHYSTPLKSNPGKKKLKICQCFYLSGSLAGVPEVLETP